MSEPHVLLYFRQGKKASSTTSVQRTWWACWTPEEKKKTPFADPSPPSSLSLSPPAFNPPARMAQLATSPRPLRNTSAKTHYCSDNLSAFCRLLWLEFAPCTLAGLSRRISGAPRAEKTRSDTVFCGRSPAVPALTTTVALRVIVAKNKKREFLPKQNVGFGLLPPLSPLLPRPFP